MHACPADGRAIHMQRTSARRGTVVRAAASHACRTNQGWSPGDHVAKIQTAVVGGACGFAIIVRSTGVTNDTYSGYCIYVCCTCINTIRDSRACTLCVSMYISPAVRSTTYLHCCLPRACPAGANRTQKSKRLPERSAGAGSSSGVRVTGLERREFA